MDLLSSVDTTIDAKIYKKITATSGVSFYNCTNGETNVVAYQQVSNNGNVLQKYQATMIKANAAIGTTWTDNITNTGQTVVQNFKIKSKPSSRNVGTFNFSDLIVVSLESGVDFPGVGFIPVSFTYYYYAKGVGLVEVITQDPLGQGFYHSVVKSYFIP